MAEASLEESWRMTRALLDRARQRVTTSSLQENGDAAAAVAEYGDMLQHNELELALDALALAGSLVPVDREFWRDLEHAAQSMQLLEHAARFREIFAAAP